MELKIPEAHQEGLAILVNYDTDEAQALFSALESAPPTLLIADLAANVATESKLCDEKVRKVLAALAGLYLLSDEGKATIDEVASAVCVALKNLPDEGKARLKGEELAQRMLEALRFTRSLGITAKAVDVKRQQERVFCAARILTDLRPVFSSTVTEKPDAAVVMHTLKIDYHKGDARKEICVALDKDDITALQQVLNRAQQKEATIKSLAQDHLTVLESSNDADSNS